MKARLGRFGIVLGVLAWVALICVSAAFPALWPVLLIAVLLPMVAPLAVLVLPDFWDWLWNG